MGRRRTLDVDETLSQETPEVQEELLNEIINPDDNKDNEVEPGENKENEMNNLSIEEIIDKLNYDIDEEDTNKYMNDYDTYINEEDINDDIENKDYYYNDKKVSNRIIKKLIKG